MEFDVKDWVGIQRLLLPLEKRAVNLRKMNFAIVNNGLHNNTMIVEEDIPDDLVAKLYIDLLIQGAPSP